MASLDPVTLENDLRSLVSEIVEIEPEQITREANFVDDLEMDSMQALEIMAAIEKKYGVQIPEEYLGKIMNLSSLFDLTMEIVNAKQ
ncbi:MAG: phosphopantetheine-binding protein [Candidatus Omnitrophota bacterium]